MGTITTGDGTEIFYKDWGSGHAAAPALLHERVTADVRRAARLIDTGLRAFAAPA